jgi:HlyD family secretion protein
MDKIVFNNQNRDTGLLSDETREILSSKPHWIVGRGNMLFAIILGLLIGFSFIISYPDMINARAKIMAFNPPQPIIAKQPGKLTRLFVSNEQEISKGQHLGCLESNTDYDEAMKLQQWVEKILPGIQAGRYEALNSSPLPALVKLGSLQGAYQEFQNQLELTRETLRDGFFNRKSAAIQKDLQYLSEIKRNAYQQQQLIVQDRQLQQKEYDAYETLAKEKVIAPLELNQYKSKLIAKEQSLKQVDVLLTNADINTHGKQKEMMDLRNQAAEQQQLFYSALLKLKSMIEEWVAQYVLVAAAGGKLVFSNSLHENQLVFYIQTGKSDFYVEVNASQAGLGKIKEGQKVLIKLESYPSEEFGSISGVVNQISTISGNSDSFLIRISLPDGLHTNFGKIINFKTGLRAQAFIITDNRKLFDRMAGQLKKILER